MSAITVTLAGTFRVEGVPAGRDAEFRRIADDQSGANYDSNAGAGGAYDFTMKPNIERDMREQAVVQARRRSTAASTSSAWPSRTSRATAQPGDQMLVQLPGVTDVARAKEIIRNTALLELKIVEAGPAPTREALLQPTTARFRATWKSSPAPAGVRRCGDRRFIWCARSRR